MNFRRKSAWQVARLLAVVLLGGSSFAFGQVSPAEIRNPQLKALEQTYLSQLTGLNREIAATKFPFQFFLSRYVGLDPREQTGTDTRGLEFVRFHDRTVLKVSGNYYAAFDANLLTQNQRANRVFDDVVVPILQLLPKYFAAQTGFDAIGFEISYHVRRKTRQYGYEGKENLVVVLSKTDAFGYPNAQSGSQRQEILNESEIYADGKDFGLLLGEREPMNVEDLGKTSQGELSQTSERAPAPVKEKEPAPAPSDMGGRLPGLNQDLPLGLRLPQRQPPASASQGSGPAALTGTPATKADVEALQSKYQSQLDRLAKDGAAHYHFVEYAVPSLVLFRDQIYLQLTLRNPTRFDKNRTSIYKRAAQSFDLFLAPLLKDLLAKIPPAPEISGLDITVLDEFDSQSPSSEALEYICPLPSLRKFTDYAITNQDLLNQSVVLVNGVRIALNLQQVE